MTRLACCGFGDTNDGIANERETGLPSLKEPPRQDHLAIATIASYTSTSHC